LYCYRLEPGGYGPPSCPAGPPNPNDPSEVATPQEAMTPAGPCSPSTPPASSVPPASSAPPAPPTPEWELWRVYPEQGDQTIFVPAATEIEVQIKDFTGVTGQFTISASPGPPNIQGFLARWCLLPIPGCSSTTSGMMLFKPAFGQDGYDLDIKYHPWAATAEGDTADATYVVKVYEPGFCGPNGCKP